MAEGGGPTRQSERERFQTPKARRRSTRQFGTGSSDTEEIIEVIDSVPAAPQSRRVEDGTHLRDRHDEGRRAGRKSRTPSGSDRDQLVTREGNEHQTNQDLDGPYQVAGEGNGRSKPDAPKPG